MAVSWIVCLVLGAIMLLLPGLSSRLAIFARVGVFLVAVGLILMVLALLRVPFP